MEKKEGETGEKELETAPKRRNLCYTVKSRK